MACVGRSRGMAEDNQPLRLQLDQRAASSVDAYIEYTRIVGPDDGGR